MLKNIRNFAIIAHVDHGKSTLADRLLELTGTVDVGKHDEQLLDRNPISRERGITIKLAPVTMKYRSNNEDYILHLIDTPGHVDFSYEVERTLACVEGVILLVDSTQGIQAQTIAHTYKALEQNLVIIPVLNKIDMPNAQVEKVKGELSTFIGVDPSDIYEISAKTGLGVQKLLEAVIEKIPAPLSADPSSQQTRGLIFDSYYDTYRGVIAFVRCVDGTITPGVKMNLHATRSTFIVEEVGSFVPDLVKGTTLEAGTIGYVVTNLKDIHKVQVGDSMLLGTDEPIEGYKKVNPMVFSSMFPTDTSDYLNLKTALEKLTLNDSALTYEQIYSQALGSGFRVGFLGLLHADVVRQRLEDEYDLSIVLTSPTVEYRVLEKEKNGKNVPEYEEPIVDVTVVTPQEYVGAVMQLCEESRGLFTHMDNQTSQVVLRYDLPLAELITHFFDTLKTVSSGYASLQWELKEYKKVDVQRLYIQLNGDPIDEFSEFVVTDRAYVRARDLVTKLKELIPRQQFEVKIQAQYKGKIIASSRIAPYRKDVTAKLYGGDRTRKDKLLKKQKAGKKKMKNIGSVEVPKDVFVKLFQK